MIPYKQWLVDKGIKNKVLSFKRKLSRNPFNAPINVKGEGGGSRATPGNLANSVKPNPHANILSSHLVIHVLPKFPKRRSENPRSKFICKSKYFFSFVNVTRNLPFMAVQRDSGHWLDSISPSPNPTAASFLQVHFISFFLSYK